LCLKCDFFDMDQGKVIDFLKGLGEFLLLLMYGVYCYAVLIFRTFVPAPKKSLDGEIMLITGSSTGIGREVVLKLAKYHPKTTLVLWDWNEKENGKTASDARKLGAQVFAFKVYVTNRGQVEETAKKVKEQVGDVTILFNNAGIARPGDFLTCNPDNLEKTVQVNLISHFWTLRAFLPSMIDKNHGHIVTTASMGAFTGVKNELGYFAAKFGIRGYTESLRDELRSHPKNPNNIYITTIFPSFVKTPMTRGVVLRVKGVDEKHAWLTTSEVATRILNGIQRNEEKVIIPKFMELTIIVKNLVPEVFYRKINSIYFNGDYNPED